jgi:glycyl-tRNA synthetase
LDSLAGLFAAGLAPTGSKDPFAQRRAALGLVGNLISWDQDLDVVKALDMAISELPIEMDPETRQACLLFISDRLHNYLRDQGFAHDVVDAVVAAQGMNPAGAFRAVKILTERVKEKDWENTLDTFARCVRITRDLDKTYPVTEKLFKEKAEKALFDGVQKTDQGKLEGGDLTEFFTLFDPLIPLITDFFDNVLVMDEDLTLRENRLGLLQIIAGYADGILDLTRLEGF